MMSNNELHQNCDMCPIAVECKNGFLRVKFGEQVEQSLPDFLQPHILQRKDTMTAGTFTREVVSVDDKKYGVFLSKLPDNEGVMQTTLNVRALNEAAKEQLTTWEHTRIQTQPQQTDTQKTNPAQNNSRITIQSEYQFAPPIQSFEKQIEPSQQGNPTPTESISAITSSPKRDILPDTTEQRKSNDAQFIQTTQNQPDTNDRILRKPVHKQKLTEETANESRPVQQKADYIRPRLSSSEDNQTPRRTTRQETRIQNLEIVDTPQIPDISLASQPRIQNIKEDDRTIVNRTNTSEDTVTDVPFLKPKITSREGSINTMTQQNILSVPENLLRDTTQVLFSQEKNTEQQTPTTEAASTPAVESHTIEDTIIMNAVSKNEEITPALEQIDQEKTPHPAPKKTISAIRDFSVHIKDALDKPKSGENGNSAVQEIFIDKKILPDIQTLLLYATQNGHKQILKHITFEYSNNGITLKVDNTLLIEFYLLIEQYLRIQEQLVIAVKKNRSEIKQTEGALEEIGENTAKMGIVTDDPYVIVIQTFALSLFGCLHCILFQNNETKIQHHGIIYVHQRSLESKFQISFP